MLVTPILIGSLGTVTKRISKGIGRLENKRMSGEYPNYRIVEIGQNTEIYSRDLRKLILTENPVKVHLLTLMGKTQME